jgi:hypothetical protein
MVCSAREVRKVCALDPKPRQRDVAVDGEAVEKVAEAATHQGGVMVGYTYEHGLVITGELIGARFAGCRRDPSERRTVCVVQKAITYPCILCCPNTAACAVESGHHTGQIRRVLAVAHQRVRITVEATSNSQLQPQREVLKRLDLVRESTVGQIIVSPHTD